MIWMLGLAAVLLAWASPSAADLTGVSSEAPVGANGTGEACKLRVIQDESARGSQRLHLYCDGWTVSSGREPGVGKAEAFRRALAAVRAKPETAHPFFWAPFVLVGDGG